jgi:hypothetical protein
MARLARSGKAVERFSNARRVFYIGDPRKVIGSAQCSGGFLQARAEVRLKPGCVARGKVTICTDWENLERPFVRYVIREHGQHLPPLDDVEHPALSSSSLLTTATNDPPQCGPEGRRSPPYK